MRKFSRRCRHFVEQQFDWIALIVITLVTFSILVIF
jgi:hypothetical protein